MSTDFTTDDIYEDDSKTLRELKKKFIDKFIAQLEDINISVNFVIVSFNNTANLTDDDSFVISIENNGIVKYGSIRFAKYGRKKISVGSKEMYSLNYQKIKNNLSHYKFSVLGLKVDKGVLKQIDYTKRSKTCKKFMEDKTVFNYGRKKKIELILSE